MSTFLAMNYDSDSDSADDLDFQPASASNSASSSSDEGSGPEDENMEEVVPKDEGSSQGLSSVAPTPEPKLAKTPKKKMSKKKVAADVDDIKPQPKKRGRKPKVVSDEAPLSKPTKAKSTKKASKPVSAVSTSAISSIHSPLGLPNTQIDMDHPLETFKWPYSPFTSEFKEQHRARGKLAQDLRLAVQEIKGTNTHANQHLQDLDNRLQLSRQDLSTCLDEIQFRKSQLRDMSLMAVDIVKKLSRQPPSFMSKPSVQDGAESDVNGSVIPNTTGMSYVDHQMMDVDQESSGDDLSGSSHSPSLKGLNEGNVRSFLEKIRELEHAQRPLA
ncbi:hypothetical protein BG005_007393 [Podila minutissima]|nr:hypothetical protein BG005_007393 [Podila minutissima]